MKKLWTWICSLKEEHGSGTVFMILMLPVVLSLAGLAIDASAAYRTKAVLQSVADAASLAAALQLPDVTAAQKAALKYANDNVPAGYGLNVLEASDIVPGTWDPSTQTFTPNTANPNAVQVLAQRSVANGNAMPTTFLGLIGISHWDVSAQAISASNVSKLWVSLVLDNTGSMCQSDPNSSGSSGGSTIGVAGNYSGSCPSGSKIAVLNAASHNLLDMLQKAAVNPGDVKVSVVPFTKDVNIGKSYVNASWLDWTEWDKANTTCTGHHHHRTCTAADHSTWDGCIMDRGLESGPDTTYNYDVSNASPVPGSASSLFPTEQCPNTLQPLMPLSDDWSALGSEIDGMDASGSTNQTIGLAWGWQTMTQGDPLDPPALPKNTSRVMILLSDGLNTANRWSNTGSSHNQAVDDRMAQACANAKAAGITIYTVYVDIAGTQGNSDVLEQCASTPTNDHYFDLTHASDITAAFNTIGQRIIRLRLVH